MNYAVVFVVDTLLVMVAWLASYWLRFNLDPIPPVFFAAALNYLPYVLVVHALLYLKYELYRGDWRYTSIADSLKIVKAILIESLVLAILLYGLLNASYIPRSVLPLYAILSVGLLAGARIVFRCLREKTNSILKSKRVLIIGAGQAGESLVRELLRQRPRDYQPVAFIDDQQHRVGRDIHGIRIVGLFRDIPSIAKQYSIDLAIIALPTASSAKMRRIVSMCEQAAIPFRTLPNMRDVAAGHVSIKSIREVLIEDLLGRQEISLDWEKIRESVKNKSILISGGGGSIGSELCRQIARMEPNKIIIIDNSEFSLYRTEMELREKYPNLLLKALLIDVTDKCAVKMAMQQHTPDLVFHAAAYKHVPLLESQIRIAIKNNVIGTCVIAQAASESNVAQFVLISTDKVVNPVNIMGATKRIAEIFCQNLNRFSKTQFITVRFGNVLGSTGSVVPLFKKQLEAGGPITVTHPEISRYFMTIPEAAQLILQAVVIGHGGEIFVLDMGEPIKIRYLAEQMIQLAGKKVNEDIEIIYTGLRPGEKLFEELFHEHEQLTSTQHKKILQAYHREMNWEKLLDIINRMQSAIEHNNESVLMGLLVELVPEYKNLNFINSSMYIEQELVLREGIE